MTMEEAILEETKFEGMREGLRKGLRQGIQKGIRKGKLQIKEELVTRMLEMNIGSDEQIVQIAKVPAAFVSRLRKRLKIN